MVAPKWSAARLLLFPLTFTLLVRPHSTLDQATDGKQIPGTPAIPASKQPAPPGQTNLIDGQTVGNDKPIAINKTIDPSARSATPYNRLVDDSNKELIDYGEDILESLDFVQTLKSADGREIINSMMGKHHNHDELYGYLAELNSQYPDLTRLYSIGESVAGRKLWAIELSQKAGKHEPLKPQFRYVANMHGNEVVGRELLLHLARLLLENYRAALEEPATESAKPTGPKFVKKLLDATRIHLLPSLNPDGYANSKVSCTYETPSRRGRVNANNVDLNRDFPDKQTGVNLDWANCQPETRAFINWTHQESFVLSGNLHGGALIALVPYSGARDRRKEKEANPTPDDDLFRKLALLYSKVSTFAHQPLSGRRRLNTDKNSRGKLTFSPFPFLLAKPEP